MNAHTQTPPLDPFAPGVRGVDVPIVKRDLSKVLFLEETPIGAGELIVEQAIGYANSGWSVFPAPPGEKKSYYKATKENGNRKWGQTTDEPEIRRYWRERPLANVCIVTGEVSGIFVVETDTAAHGESVDGAASLAALEAEHGMLPATLQAVSPSGSVHRYFKHPGCKVINSESVIAPGVDVRGDGGMVVAPPSWMPAREATEATLATPATDGKRAREAKKAKPARAAGAYRWLNDLPVADAPQWLLDRNVSADKPKTISERAQALVRPPQGAFPGAFDNFWRRVKDLALTDRTGWVQALFGNRAQLKSISGMQVWRITSEDLGRDLEEDLSIAPNGIRDWGTEENLTAIDVVMRFGNKREEEAALWLCEKMGIDPKELGWNDQQRPAPVTTGPTADNNVVQLPGTKPASIPLTFFDDVENFAAKVWLLKDAIAKGETSEWIAPPGKLKSALMTDISVHIAAGADWRGYKSKETCGVVYFALERGDLVKRRLTAHRRRNDLKGLPIAVASGVFDLMHPANVAIMVETIRAAEARFGRGVGFVVIDTLAKGVAAGGGDENQAKDLGAALANLRRVQDQTGAHVAIVSHTGKDESRGARGSNSQVGDVDLLVQISGDAIKVATVTKANDQEEGVLTASRIFHFASLISEPGRSARSHL